MGQQPIPMSALERRRRQLLTAPTTGPATLPTFERARERTRAQTGAASRQANLDLQRLRAQTGGFGAGAGIKLGQQAQQQLQEREAAQIADITAQESDAIRQERLARESMQLQGLEAERGREFKKGLFDIEQKFKEDVFDFEKDTKLKMMAFEKEKFDFDKQTAIFNKVMAAMSLPDDRETNRILGNLWADPETPAWLKAGLSVYRNAALTEKMPLNIGIPKQPGVQ